MKGVSFVVPVHNGAACLRDSLASIRAQDDGRPFEVIVVDDGGDDGSSALIASLASAWALRVVPGPGRGAAAALNAGIRIARHPIVCQVDQDVTIAPGWMTTLVAALEDERIGAAQGYYECDSRASIAARVMGLDLEQRYCAITSAETSHVCTGNVAYRAEALRRAGPFDESLGYGYDNDMSYRLRAAGYTLTISAAARSRHAWREGLVGYMVQQYGFGYGRLDIVRKHPSRVGGDAVSPAWMMAHPIAMAIALAGFALAPFAALAGATPRALLTAGGTIVAGLALERLVSGIAAARRFHDRAALLFPFWHLARDLVWVAAIVTWSVRHLLGRRSRPSHSMRPRRDSPAPVVAATMSMPSP